MTQSRFNENASYVQLDRKELKRLRRSYAVAVIDEKFKPGMGRATGKARAVEIKNKIIDMTDRLNKKLGIPNLCILRRLSLQCKFFFRFVKCDLGPGLGLMKYYRPCRGQIQDLGGSSYGGWSLG